MRSQHGLWCGVVLLSASLALAESKKGSNFKPLDPKAAELVAPIKPAAPPSNAQQGNNQQGQFPPGQGPNNKIPAPAQPPPAIQNQPVIPAPLPDSAGDAANHSDAVRAAAEVRETIESMRQVQDGIDLGILDADAARNRPDGLDPAARGRQSDDFEAASLIDQIQGVTGGSHRDGWSDTTKGYADSAGLTPDTGAMRAGRVASGGGADRTPPNRSPAGGGEDTTRGPTETTDPNTGVTTREEKRPDGTTVVTTTTPGQGSSYQVETVEYNQDGNPTSVRTLTSLDGGDDLFLRSSRYLGGGVWENRSTTSQDGGAHWDTGERNTSARAPAIRGSPPSHAGDPDHPYGHGSGDLPGKKRETVWDNVAGSHTPGGRPPPDDQGGRPGPRVNLAVDLVGQPNPDDHTGGSSGGSMIRNPNDDTVLPPPPTPVR